MTRIVLATAGSLGDLHPFIALGRALQNLGFRAEIASSAEYRAKVEAEGLGFHAVGPSLAELCADLGMTPAEITRAVARSDRFLFDRIMLPRLEAGTRQLLAVAEGAAAIAGSTFAAGASIAADRLGVPFVSIALQPTVVMSAYDPPFLPRAPWLAPADSGARLWLNRATLALARRTTDAWGRPIDAVRESFGLPPTRANPLFDGLGGTALSLGLYSPLLGARQADAPERFHVVGQARYDSDTGGRPSLPLALAEFLSEGPAPIVFTLGSAAVNIPGDFYRQSLAAARAIGRRAVLLVGPDGDPSIADGPDAIAVPYAPFSLLFPFAAATVHQGGVGTTQDALHAGRPQLVVPHLGDQFDNAARVVRLGCAATLRRSEYRAPRVANILTRLLGEPAVAARAALAGQAIAAEDGAARAADLIAALIAKPSVTVAAPSA